MVDERISRAIDNDHTAAMKDNGDGQKLSPKKGGSSFVASGNVSICTLCKKVFKNHIIYRKHLKLHTDKSFVCQVCSKSFVHKHYLQAHMLVHNKHQHFPCHLCHKRFSQKGNLSQHLKFHACKKPFICEICGKDFFQQEHLKAHLRHHNNERPFSCDLCQKSFNIKSSLQRHMNCHTGAKPFICDICNRGYTRRSVLILHIQQVHENKKPFQCTECKLCFSQKGNLQAHFRRKHLQPKLEVKKQNETNNMQGKKISKKQSSKQITKHVKPSTNGNDNSFVYISVESKGQTTDCDSSVVINDGESDLRKKDASNSEESISCSEDSVEIPIQIDNPHVNKEDCCSSIGNILAVSSKKHISNFASGTDNKINNTRIENNQRNSFGTADNLLCQANNTQTYIVPDLDYPCRLESPISVQDELKSIADFGSLLEDTKCSSGSWEDILLSDPDNILNQPCLQHFDEMSELLCSPVKVNGLLSKTNIEDDLFPNLSLPVFHDYAGSSPIYVSEDLVDSKDTSVSHSKNVVRMKPHSKQKEKSVRKIQNKKSNRTVNRVITKSKTGRKSINVSIYESCKMRLPKNIFHV